LGPSACLRGAATEQRDLQQRPQHSRHQQRDEHRDHYESERADPDRAAFSSDGACGPARRWCVAASDAGSSSVRPRVAASGAGCRDLARPGVATFGRAQGRHASDPVPPGRRRAAERARLSGDTITASTRPAIARDEGAASPNGDRHSDNTKRALGRDRAEHAITGAWQYEAGTGAVASARVNSGDANVSLGRDNARNAVIRARNAAEADCNNPFGRDRAGDVITGAWRYEAGTGAVASARVNSGDTNVSLGRDNARNAVISAGRRCQARHAADADTNNSFGRDCAGDVNTIVCRAGQAQNAAVANTGCEAVAINPLGRGHAGCAVGWRQRQAATTTAAEREAFGADAFSRDHAGHAIAWRRQCEAHNAVTASAPWKISKTIVATVADQARDGIAVATSWKRCEAPNTVTTSSCRKSDAAACRRKADCTSSRRCAGSAQACSTAAKGMSTREEDGCGQWPASL
jgi:hypothetical protein